MPAIAVTLTESTSQGQSPLHRLSQQAYYVEWMNSHGEPVIHELFPRNLGLQIVERDQWPSSNWAARPFCYIILVAGSHNMPQPCIWYYVIYIYIHYEYNTCWVLPVAERPLPIGSEPIWKVTLSSPIELHLYTYLENAAKLLQTWAAREQVHRLLEQPDPLVDRAAHQHL